MNDKRVNQYLILPEAGQRKDTKLAVEYDEEQIAEYVANGYVIVNQADFNKLIGNADGEYLIADDGSVYPYEGLTKLIVTKDMAERKTKMIELGDAFIAFPGGVGTLEEVSEIMSKISLGHLQAPCIYYNLDGYYDDIKHFLQQMIAKGFSSEEKQQGVYFAESLEKIKELLK